MNKFNLSTYFHNASQDLILGRNTIYFLVCKCSFCPNPTEDSYYLNP